MKTYKKILFILIPLIIVFAIIIAILCYLHYKPIWEKEKQYERDITRLTTESYDTLFFSMYPTEYYNEEDYAYFRAMDIVKTELSIPDAETLNTYMDTAMNSGNEVTTIYLGITPDMIDTRTISNFLEDYPTCMFEIVLSYPDINYWLHQEEAAYLSVIQAYEDFAADIITYENARIQLFSGTEWLICNPGNYMDTLNTNMETSKMLMANTDGSHHYALCPDTMEEAFENMRNLVASYRKTPPNYPDLSNMDIVFIGDSIFGNYTDSMSIPGVVNGLTSARVYNLGIGGMSAANRSDNTLSLSVVLDAITEGDTSGLPMDSVAMQDTTTFLNREKSDAPLVFVLNFGLNDYFDGLPVDSSDALDADSYKGALRLAIYTLKESYPDAQVILITPNFTIQYENGEQIMSENGGRLKNYVDAVIMLGEEMKVAVLDSYGTMPVNEENSSEYLADGCHLNERGRFFLGSHLIELIDIEQ